MRIHPRACLALFAFAGCILHGASADATELAAALAPLVRIASSISTPAITVAPAANRPRAAHHRSDHRAAYRDTDADGRVGLGTTVPGSEQLVGPARLGRRWFAHDAVATAGEPDCSHSPHRHRDESRQILRL